MRRRKCRYCGGPMPSPASTGRPAVYCSITCRRDNEYAVAQARSAEQERRDRPRREAEARARREKLEAEAARARERERRRILAAGGIDALDLLQREAFENGRCGWYDDDQETLEVCLRPTDESFVWCKKHNRQLDREAEQRRREKERGSTSFPTPTIRGGSEHV
jgi:hypothetical protein